MSLSYDSHLPLPPRSTSDTVLMVTEAAKLQTDRGRTRGYSLRLSDGGGPRSCGRPATSSRTNLPILTSRMVRNVSAAGPRDREVSPESLLLTTSANLFSSFRRAWRSSTRRTQCTEIDQGYSSDPRTIDRTAIKPVVLSSLAVLQGRIRLRTDRVKSDDDDVTPDDDQHGTHH